LDEISFKVGISTGYALKKNFSIGTRKLYKTTVFGDTWTLVPQPSGYYHYLVVASENEI
jgi:hypothetical protein